MDVYREVDSVDLKIVIKYSPSFLLHPNRRYTEANHSTLWRSSLRLRITSSVHSKSLNAHQKKQSISFDEDPYIPVSTRSTVWVSTVSIQFELTSISSNFDQCRLERYRRPTPTLSMHGGGIKQSAFPRLPNLYLKMWVLICVIDSENL